MKFVNVLNTLDSLQNICVKDARGNILYSGQARHYGMSRVLDDLLSCKVLNLAAANGYLIIFVDVVADTLAIKKGDKIYE